MTRFAVFLPLMLGAGLAACTAGPGNVTSVPDSRAEMAKMSTITGSIAYRERIALRPGAVMQVTLSDISLADAAAPELASETRAIGANQVPLPFSLQIRSDALKPNMRYAVRATIRDEQGKLLWTTDTVYLIDPVRSVQDLGTLNLVRIVSGDANMLRGDWSVNSIGGNAIVDRSAPSITFGNDGRVNGATGCNNFMGSYTINGNAISFGPLASTRKACIPALSEQEAAMLAILGSASGWNVDGTGKLTVTGGDGRSIVGMRR